MDTKLNEATYFMYNKLIVKSLIIPSLIFFLITNVKAQQNPGIINGFKYAYVNQIIYQNGLKDIYGIIPTMKNDLTKIGLIVLDDDRNNWPKEAKLNPCLIGFWASNTGFGSLAGSATAKFQVKNCKGEIVYENSSGASHFGYSYDQNVPLAMEKAFKPLNKLAYYYSETLTPTIDYPKVESTNETELTLKTYFDNNVLDPIEGIYQSYQDDNSNFYKIAIQKSNGTFKVIVIESELPQWKQGEIKAYLEPSSMQNLYSVKWYLANKSFIQTFCSLENNAVLSVELRNRNNEKELSKFIKMYPSANNHQIANTNAEKASGTGFVISKDGIIATNSHVITDASKIELVIKNEIGTFTYKAKVLLNDSKNDVALLQINDSNFKGFSIIPFSFNEKVEIGEKVFTIGYPLNDIMGTNFKVNDGIVSSTSGIADDVRYLQISVPIQPGNSGGPLFNKDGNVIAITSSRLNSKAVGTEIENVNYAIKISYLLNLFNTLPNSNQIFISTLSGKDLQDQVKVLKNFVCLIKIY